MPNEREPASAEDRPASAVTASGGDEPEPEWAEEIRARRRARGDRLREIFATFDDEPEPSGSDPREPRP